MIDAEELADSLVQNHFTPGDEQAAMILRTRLAEVIRKNERRLRAGRDD